MLHFIAYKILHLNSSLLLQFNTLGDYDVFYSQAAENCKNYCCNVSVCNICIAKDSLECNNN